MAQETETLGESARLPKTPIGYSARLPKTRGPLGDLARWPKTGAPWKLNSHAQIIDVYYIYTEMLCCGFFLIAFEAIDHKGTYNTI